MIDSSNRRRYTKRRINEDEIASDVLNIKLKLKFKYKYYYKISFGWGKARTYRLLECFEASFSPGV